MINILIINGPNLNLLGEREKDKYGNTSIEQIKKNCLSFSKENNISSMFDRKNVIMTKSDNDITEEILVILNKN